MKILSDFEKYGIDPTKMASWSPKLITRGPRKQSSSKNDSNDEDNSEIGTTSQSAVMHKIELALRPDKKFVIIVPMDISQSEATTIKAVLDSLVVKK